MRTDASSRFVRNMQDRSGSDAAGDVCSAWMSTSSSPFSPITRGIAKLCVAAATLHSGVSVLQNEWSSKITKSSVLQRCQFSAYSESASEPGVDGELYLVLFGLDGP